MGGNVCKWTLGSCKYIIICQWIYSGFQNIYDLNAMLFTSQSTMITKKKKK